MFVVEKSAYFFLCTKFTPSQFLGRRYLLLGGIDAVVTRTAERLAQTPLRPRIEIMQLVTDEPAETAEDRATPSATKLRKRFTSARNAKLRLNVIG